MTRPESSGSSDHPRPALTVLARAPEPGRVKTRLAASIGEQAACELHAAMTLDVIEHCASWLGPVPSERPPPLVLSLTGDESAAAPLARLALELSGRVERQVDGTLGDRIRACVERRCADTVRTSISVRLSRFPDWQHKARCPGSHIDRP